MLIIISNIKKNTDLLINCTKLPLCLCSIIANYSSSYIESKYEVDDRIAIMYSNGKYYESGIIKGIIIKEKKFVYKYLTNVKRIKLVDEKYIRKLYKFYPPKPNMYTNSARTDPINIIY